MFNHYNEDIQWIKEDFERKYIEYARLRESNCWEAFEHKRNRSRKIKT